MKFEVDILIVVKWGLHEKPLQSRAEVSCFFFVMQLDLANYITGQQNFLRNVLIMYNAVMFSYVSWGADFENGIENFVVLMVLPLFEDLRIYDFKFA